MCGIIGIFGSNSKEFISDNLFRLNRRGPDSQGMLHLENGLTFGACRLAMTDPLPRSNQPMQDPYTGDIIVFNGEIYNHISIKKRVSQLKVRFETESDTEVLLKLISYIGENAIQSLEGMFAFAHFNKRKNCISLVRDYLGKKPLFYYYNSYTLIFSSQIDLIRDFLPCTTLDQLSLSNYLRLGYTLDPRTMYSEIKSVLPGEIIQFNLDDLSHPRVSHFTPTKIVEPSNFDLAESLDRAILERTKGHNSFSISLSGGLDSNLIALRCVKLGLNFNAYSMRWPSSDKSRYNTDSELAQKNAHTLGIKCSLVDMPEISDIEDRIEKYVKAMGEPNSSPTGISMMNLYSAICQDKNRLVLTGDGSDEVFGGYARYSIAKKYGLLPQFRISFLKSILAARTFSGSSITKFASILSPKNNDSFWFYWHELSGKNFLKRFYENYNSQELSIYRDNSFDFFLTNRTSELMFKDLKIWLTMESNRKLDRISMWYSIEARSPFQSEQLISIGCRKMHNSKFRLLNKELLKSAFPEINRLELNQKKMGFISPLGHWLRQSPELIYNSLEYLRNNFSFDMIELNSLVNSPHKGNYNEFRFLWNLIILAKWHEAQ
jgi:asparagine synthase (glutamine-hydrolysing)